MLRQDRSARHCRELTFAATDEAPARHNIAANYLGHRARSANASCRDAARGHARPLPDAKDREAAVLPATPPDSNGGVAAAPDGRTMPESASTALRRSLVLARSAHRLNAPPMPARRRSDAGTNPSA